MVSSSMLIIASSFWRLGEGYEISTGVGKSCMILYVRTRVYAVFYGIKKSFEIEAI